MTLRRSPPVAPFTAVLLAAACGGPAAPAPAPARSPTHLVRPWRAAPGEDLGLVRVAPPPSPPPVVAPTAPADPDALVDLSKLDPTIVLDLRYATAANVTGAALYPVARCLLRRDVAERLVRVQAALAAGGERLAVWDCYRPFSAQEALWQRKPDARYVARPVRGDDGAPREGSKHNRGAAVDLTIVDAARVPREMPTEFDDFTARAHRGDRRASPAARANAARLEAAMVAEGFEPLPTEWWHFDGPEWQRYPLADDPL